MGERGRSTEEVTVLLDSGSPFASKRENGDVVEGGARSVARRGFVCMVLLLLAALGVLSFWDAAKSAVSRLVDANGRVVDCPQEDLEERGKCVREKTISGALALLEWKHVEHAGQDKRWNEIKAAGEKSMALYTPDVLEELEAMSGSADERDTLLYLATEYDLQMFNKSRRADHCSGYVSAETNIAGQTNDETPSRFLGGDHDVALKFSDAVIYSHTGYPAYMGVNRRGLVVLWEYIDDGSRNYTHGVPTVAIIRHILNLPSLQDALAFLRSIPHMVPNSFQLMQPGAKGVPSIAIAECSPELGVVVKEQDYGGLVHTNHIVLDSPMKNREIGHSTLTHERFAFLDKKSKEAKHQVDEKLLESWLSGPCCDNGVMVDRTLAAMVFEVDPVAMHIKFRGDSDFQKVAL